MSDTPGEVENLVLMAGGHPKVPQATLEEKARTHDAADARRDAVLAQAREALAKMTMCGGCGAQRGHVSRDKRVCGCSISTIRCERCAVLAAIDALEVRLEGEQR